MQILHPIMQCFQMVYKSPSNKFRLRRLVRLRQMDSVRWYDTLNISVQLLLFARRGHMKSCECWLVFLSALQTQTVGLQRRNHEI